MLGIGPGEQRLVGGRQAGVQNTGPVQMLWAPNRPGRGTDLAATLEIERMGSCERVYREGGGLIVLFKMGKELEVGVGRRSSPDWNYTKYRQGRVSAAPMGIGGSS